MSTRIVIRVEQNGRIVRRFVVGRDRFRTLSFGVLLGLLFLSGSIALGTYQFMSVLGNSPSARAENLLLRSRLASTEGQMARVDQSLDRVMAYDSKIRRLTRDDSGARAFGIGPLSELEIAAAERDGIGVSLPGEELGFGQQRSRTDLVGMLDDLDRRARQLEERVMLEEESLQEVRGYLDDRTSLLRAHPTLWPVRGWLTSRFGWRRSPMSGGRRLHTGIDIAAPRGTPIIAPADAHVVFSGYHSAYGNMVILDHGYGMTTKYAHNSRMLVRVGDRVYRGDVIARVGNTGRSTGPHLHFEVHKDGVPTNPMRYLNRR